jgi:hypothetical protein
MRLLTISFILFTNISCAYRFGYGQRALPGGYKQVAIPVFKNKSSIIGAEVGFTNALIREFARSGISDIVPKDSAPAVIEGVIEDVEFVHLSQTLGSGDDPYGLPENTVLTSEYRVLLKAQLKLRRVSDNTILWEQVFSGERVYSAPQVGKRVVNSVNPLYDHSARYQIVEELALDAMSEAHSRMTESF